MSTNTAARTDAIAQLIATVLANEPATVRASVLARLQGGADTTPATIAARVFPAINTTAPTRATRAPRAQTPTPAPTPTVTPKLDVKAKIAASKAKKLAAQTPAAPKAKGKRKVDAARVAQVPRPQTPAPVVPAKPAKLVDARSLLSAHTTGTACPFCTARGLVSASAGLSAHKDATRAAAGWVTEKFAACSHSINKATK